MGISKYPIRIDCVQPIKVMTFHEQVLLVAGAIAGMMAGMDSAVQKFCVVGLQFTGSPIGSGIDPAEFDMASPLPLCCNLKAFKLLSGQLPHLHKPNGLMQCACAVAMHHRPDVNVSQVDAMLSMHADAIRARVRGSQEQALVAHLHEYLFEEIGLRGNSEDYYNPGNSCLPVVLETKLGLPIALSLIYQLIAHRIGLKSWGVGLPGHFLAGIEVNGKTMLVDTFAKGRILTEDDAHDRMKEIFGSEVDWSSELLRPASHRHWLTRMLQNLLNIFSKAQQYDNVAAMLEMEILLWPEQSRLQRDLALVLARVGMTQPASIWLGKYLKGNPDDPQSDDLKHLLEVLTA